MKDNWSNSRYRNGWKAGVRAASDVADNYNSVVLHDYRLGDCIAGKLNARNGKPRRNRQRPEPLEQTLVRGIVLGVAEMLRVCHDQQAAYHALTSAGITRESAKKAGVMDTDLDEIDWNTNEWKRRSKERR